MERFFDQERAPNIKVHLPDRIFIVCLWGFDEAPTRTTHSLLFERLDAVFPEHRFISHRLLICRERTFFKGREPIRCPFYDVFHGAVSENVRWSATLSAHWQYCFPEYKLKIEAFLEATGGNWNAVATPDSS